MEGSVKMKLSDVGLLALWLVAAAVVVAGAYALAHVTTMTQSMRPRAVVEPVCDTSQLKVSVAAHYTDLHTGYVIAPMTFTNSART